MKKINHSKKVLSKKTISISLIEFPNIIDFKYKSKNMFDRNPLVFVLSKKTDIVRNKKIAGINLNYLNDKAVEKLVLEKDEKKLKHWILYKDGYRTYSTDKIMALKLVEFETEQMKKTKQLGLVEDTNKPKQPEKPNQPKKPKQTTTPDTMGDEVDLGETLISKILGKG
jgi:hypothetical protein